MRLALRRVARLGGDRSALHELGSKANTVRDDPGHHSYGADFNVSANQAGCFPYQHEGQTYSIDLSLSDLPYDPNAGSAGDYATVAVATSWGRRGGHGAS